MNFNAREDNNATHVRHRFVIEGGQTARDNGVRECSGTREDDNMMVCKSEGGQVDDAQQQGRANVQPLQLNYNQAAQCLCVTTCKTPVPCCA